jgi:spermidine synthase
MNWRRLKRRATATAGLVCLALASAASAGVVFEATSPYHHITVVDEGGFRKLSFDGAIQSRMSLQDARQGHFEYTEYFHLAWLWNRRLTQVLMIGLGGASAQRAFEHYYPEVIIETAEIDPVVRRVAKEFFGLKESPRQNVYVEDGRVCLARTQNRYDLIVLDAYTRNRYGCFIPYHLATREFFELAFEHLKPEGVLAYNVVTAAQGQHGPMLGAVYQSLKAVFPQVYWFPARESRNIVLLATKSDELLSRTELLQRGAEMVRTGFVTLPSWSWRAQVCQTNPPAAAAGAKVLTDDFAPVERLQRSR